jgi:membrane-associated phospholipid phosphatase
MNEAQERQVKRISGRIAFGVLSFLLALYIFGAIAHGIFHHNAKELDEIVFSFLADRTTKDVVQWMRVLSFFGKPHFLIPAYLLLIILYLWKKEKGMAREIGIVGATSTIVSFGLKFLFQRNRPAIQVLDYLGGYSFPSGHAFLGFIFCSLLIYLIWKSEMKGTIKFSLGFLLFVFSIAIGASRIVLRVHYASDVIAGFALGYAWVLIFFWMREKPLSNLEPRSHSVTEKH